MGEGRDRHSFVAAADVAAFAVNAVDNPAAANQTIPIGGPAALSWLDAVSLFEQALGRPIQVNHVQAGQPLPGLPPFMAELMAGFGRYSHRPDGRDRPALRGATDVIGRIREADPSQHIDAGHSKFGVLVDTCFGAATKPCETERR